MSLPRRRHRAPGRTTWGPRKKAHAACGAISALIPSRVVIAKVDNDVWKVAGLLSVEQGVNKFQSKACLQRGMRRSRAFSIELKGVNVGGGKRKVASTMTLPRDVISLRRAPGFLLGWDYHPCRPGTPDFSVYFWTGAVELNSKRLRLPRLHIGEVGGGGGERVGAHHLQDRLDSATV